MGIGVEREMLFIVRGLWRKGISMIYLGFGVKVKWVGGEGDRLR